MAVNRSFKKGVTLVETIVALGLFSVTVAIVGNIFIITLQSQNWAFGAEKIFDQTSFVIEYLGRSLRMAKKEINCADHNNPATCACLQSDGYGFNYEITHSGHGIKFINSQNVCEEIFLEANASASRLKKIKTSETDQYLTSADLRVIDFKVNLIGESQEDKLQPRATLFLEVEGTRGRPRPKINLQTTISQRKSDIRY